MAADLALQAAALAVDRSDPALQAPFLAGLGVQLVVATLLGAFLSRFARAAARIARILLRRKLPVRPAVLPLPSQPAAMPTRLLGLAAVGVRAPPAC